MNALIAAERGRSSCGLDVFHADRCNRPPLARMDNVTLSSPRLPHPQASEPDAAAIDIVRWRRLGPNPPLAEERTECDLSAGRKALHPSRRGAPQMRQSNGPGGHNAALPVVRPRQNKKKSKTRGNHSHARAKSSTMRLSCSRQRPPARTKRYTDLAGGRADRHAQHAAPTRRCWSTSINAGAAASR
jgi:hypothetical protein